jgi:hypothetical protein
MRPIRAVGTVRRAEDEGCGGDSVQKTPDSDARPMAEKRGGGVADGRDGGGGGTG